MYIAGTHMVAVCSQGQNLQSDLQATRHEELTCYSHSTADLNDWICSQLAAEVDMHIWLVEGLDGNGIGVLPGYHLQHHLIPAHMGQLLHGVYCLYAHLQYIAMLFYLRRCTSKAWLLLCCLQLTCVISLA